MKILAVIPARGGSKGIPQKNIIPLVGQPLISYSIKQAQKSDLIDKVVVSSDDEQILSVAQAYGAEIIKRPPELAQDTSVLDGTIRHILESLKKEQGYTPDLIVLLQPTSPLRSVATINDAIGKFIANANEFDSLIPLVETSNKVGIIRGSKFIPRYPVGAQRQELETLYREAGTIFILKPLIIRAGGFFGERICAYLINPQESLDIDSLDDLKMAEFYLQKLL